LFCSLLWILGGFIQWFGKHIGLNKIQRSFATCWSFSHNLSQDDLWILIPGIPDSADELESDVQGGTEGELSEERAG